jgi:hypothetical protein
MAKFVHGNQRQSNSSQTESKTNQNAQIRIMENKGFIIGSRLPTLTKLKI